MKVVEINEKEILDKLPNPVFLRDENGHFIYVNNHFLEFFDVSLDRVIGHNNWSEASLFQICHSKLPQLEKGDQTTCEPFQLSSQSKLWHQVSVSIFDLHNGHSGHLGVISDVSARVNAQKALETTRMFETSVHHVSQSVLGSFDEDEIIRTFVTGTFKEFNLEDCVVYLTDENEDLFRVAALSKTETEVQTNLYRIARDKGVVGRALRTQQTQLVNDTRKDPDYFSEETYGLSELVVPIIHQGQVLGILDSEHSALGFFTEDYRRTFETCASLLALKLVEARTMRELHQQKSTLAQILESPKDLQFFSIDKNLCYTYFNSKHEQTMQELWGSTIELGKSVLNYISNPTDQSLAKKHLTRGLMGEEFTLTQKYGNGGEYWQDIFTPHFSTNGKIEGASVFTRNTTDIITARKKLLENEQLLTSIHENIPSGLFRAPINEKITYVNSSMPKLFGYTDKEIKQLSMAALFADEAAYLNWIEVLYKKQSLHGFEAKLKRKSGETFMGLINSTFWVNPEGVIQLDGAISDLSELHHTKIELEQNNFKLQKINAELDHIVYRTSHDMRSPVASMLGLMELINIPEDEENELYLSMLKSQILRLDGIIHDIVNYRKVGTVGITPEDLDLEQIMNAVFRDLAYLNDCENITKKIEVVNPLGLSLICDRFNLEIIANNLLSNAIKYSDRKKTERTIDVRIKVDEYFCYLEIEDNGIGISEEYHHKVFDMFFRATNTKNGTGLGLFILKEAVNKLEGKISMHSEIGVGSTFSLRIPRVVKESQTENKEQGVLAANYH